MWQRSLLTYTLLVWLLASLNAVAMVSGWWSGEQTTSGNPGESGAKLSSQKLPSCIIIGARKGGTRALLDFLDMHPNVLSAAAEIHFFDNDTRFANGHLDTYRSLMPPGGDDQIVCEKTPAYFSQAHKTAARLHHLATSVANQPVAESNSTLRLLLVLRDPVQRAVSDYTQVFHNNLDHKAIRIQPFETFALQPAGDVNVQYKAIQIGRYHLYLQHFLKFFKLNSTLLVLNAEMLRLKPYETLKRVEQFLQLPDYYRPEQFVFNATKGFYCKQQTSGAPVVCLTESKGRRHCDVQNDTVSKLRQYYRADNERLFTMINQTFSEWL